MTLIYYRNSSGKIYRCEEKSSEYSMMEKHTWKLLQMTAWPHTYIGKCTYSQNWISVIWRILSMPVRKHWIRRGA